MWQVCHGYDSDAQKTVYEASGANGVNDGPNDVMPFHNPYNSNQQEWDGYTANSVWDLHSAALYSSPSDPRVQYQINGYTTPTPTTRRCAGAATPLGRTPGSPTDRLHRLH
eukprot:Sspe_Gene.92405::Locus_64629_Transcript_1_1_Confidence_1.000_Length_332::g.92405::m.92405